MVEVRGLTKSFGGFTAVSGLTFSVPQGEIFGFIGPNGAGKTTTLRMLATLLDPTAGEAFVGGFSVRDDTERVRGIVGYMPDHFGVYDGITVEEYLEFFAAAFRIPSPSRSTVLRDVLDLTDLGALRHRMVSTLSKGVKQRLCLAKTLIHDPRLLILDEPASALDPRGRVEMRALLKELSRMQKTIIISSHILTELSDLCTSVAIIEKGKLVACGDMGLLEKERRADRVKITLSEPPRAVESVLAASPAVRDVRVEEKAIRFEYLGAAGDFHKVLKVLTDAEVPVVSVEHETRDLEDLFMELTRGDVQ